jgi:hypothetical protein
MPQGGFSIPEDAGDGDLVCCGQNMELLTGDEAAPFVTPPSMRPGNP